MDPLKSGATANLPFLMSLQLGILSIAMKKVTETELKPKAYISVVLYPLSKGKFRVKILLL